jgi:hypothetical protein
MKRRQAERRGDEFARRELEARADEVADALAPSLDAGPASPVGSDRLPPGIAARATAARGMFYAPGTSMGGDAWRPLTRALCELCRPERRPAPRPQEAVPPVTPPGTAAT